MKKDIVIFAVLATVCTLSSCSQEPDVIGNDPGQGVTVFTATIESGATKTALSGNGDNYDVLWRSGDAIAVADEAGTPNVGLYTTESVTDHADFSLRSGAAVTTPSFKAWYPADLYNDGTPVLPEVQTYVEGGSATEGNICRAPMYAVSGTSTLLLKKVTVTGNVMSDEYGPQMSVRGTELATTDVQKEAEELYSIVEGSL